MNEMELQTTLDPIEMDMGDPVIEYSPVYPNPEGDPTDDLTKVLIQGDIYKVKDPEVHDWARTEEKPTYTKDEVGLGNVDNTSDMDKPVSTATQTALDNKVDKVAGKGLSEEDFTHTLKNKLDGIEAGAEVNTVNSVAGKTGNVTLNKSDVGLGNVDNTSDMNKPVSTATQEALQGLASATQTALNGKVDNSTLNNYYTATQTDNLLNGKVDKDGDKVLSDNNYSDTDKSKLDGIEEEANKTVVDNSVTATSINPVESRAIYNLLNDLLPEAEETGNPITISNASGFNAKALTVDMLPIQAGSGIPSPDNVRPISGRNSLDITVNGNTETVNFGETVYSGTCDVVNGGTSDEWAIVDLGTLNWDKIENNNYRNFTSKALNPISYYNANEKTVICEAYKSESYNSASQQGDIYIWIVNSNMIAIKDTSKSGLTANEFKNAVSGIKACYKLATPTTLTTPATPISLNKGNNTLSTSGDNMDLKYSTTISNPTSLTMARPTLSLSSPTVEEPTEETDER